MAYNTRTNETKVLRDPIHGYIHMDYQILWDAINTREFQRLHRIHQLGGVFQVYHTAEHSRFAHSLGVYEIVRRIVFENEDISKQLIEEEKIQVMLAGLLHDLGHGPFSHFFESVTHQSHEERTWQILLDRESEIGHLLYSNDPKLPEDVVKILNHTHSKELLSSIVSSQLDADRMDYLLRDAYETGTSYGKFDLERVLRTLRCRNGKICVKKSGMHSIEDYIMARYHMYWQVYLHPDALSYEILIEKFFNRYKEIRNKAPIALLEPLYDKPFSNDDFYLFDENRLFCAFQEALKHEDPILKDFAKRILDRHLFEWIEDVDSSEEEKILLKLKEKNLDSKWYFEENISKSDQNLPYTEKDESCILILDSKGKLNRLASESSIVSALQKMDIHTQKRIYFDKSVAD